MPNVHFDEAKAGAIATIKSWLSSAANDVRVLLVADLFGKLRLTMWCDSKPNLEQLNEQLTATCATWWTAEVLYISELDTTTSALYDRLWSETRPDLDSERLRVVDRHRSRTAWFSSIVSQPWQAPEQGPPIVVFYSFKGGLGRSTTLASFAIQRSRMGERICVLDFDLDSPGIGTVLSADTAGLTARWGVVDYLLEKSVTDIPLSDYYHRCDRISGEGQILVFPAGYLDDEYADKLARVDLEEAPNAKNSGIWSLLARVRDELKPHWILLDARTGISEPAGQLLSGIAHLHVLLSNASAQSWLGLNRVLDKVGRDRILQDAPQEEVILVHAMVPTGEAGRQAQVEFSAKAEDEFDDRYYAADDADGEDALWTMADKGTEDAPHVSIPLDYDSRLADFRDIAEVATLLCEGRYLGVATRIASRFARESES